MPELPEVEALAAYLRERAVGRRVERVDVAAISALKTFDPPPTAPHGRTVTGAGRHGKFLDLELGDDLHLVVHLARAGWLHYRDALPATPLKPGKGPIALRVRLDDGVGLRPDRGRHAEEARRLPGPRPGAGARRRPARARTRSPSTRPTFAARMRSRRGQIKGVLTDQEVLAGIGNAYSDEILHAAKLSPFAITDRLTDEQMATLYEATQAGADDAVAPVGGAGRGRASRARSAPACRCTPAPGCPARSAATPSARSRSPTRACSTARPARPAASRLADRRLSKLRALSSGLSPVRSCPARKRLTASAAGIHRYSGSVPASTARADRLRRAGICLCRHGSEPHGSCAVATRAQRSSERTCHREDLGEVTTSLDAR